MHRRLLAPVLDESSRGNLYFRVSSHLDLANPLTRKVEFNRKGVQRSWFIDEMTGLKDALLAIVERADGAGKRLLPVIHFVIVEDNGFG